MHTDGTFSSTFLWSSVQLKALCMKMKSSQAWLLEYMM